MILPLIWLKMMALKENIHIKGVSKHVIPPLKRNYDLIIHFNFCGYNLTVGKGWDVRKVRKT